MRHGYRRAAAGSDLLKGLHCRNTIPDRGYPAPAAEAEAAAVATSPNISGSAWLSSNASWPELLNISSKITRNIATTTVLFLQNLVSFYWENAIVIELNNH